MSTTKDNKLLYFVTSAYTLRKGTGSDFYLDLITYFKSKNYRTFNTLKYGHFLLLFYELFLLARIPRNSRVITTWVGWPRQLLVFEGRGNFLRAYLFGMIKNLKSWDLIVIPIDLPLKQYGKSLKSSVIRRVQKSENHVFSSVDTFLTCGNAMSIELKRRYPLTQCIQFDMYDQLLPEANKEGRKKPNAGIEIVLSGNLNRMVRRINELPKVPGLEYHLTGPLTNGNKAFERKDIHYHGLLSEQCFVNLLSRVDYGLVLYDKNVEDYFSLVISGKVTSYLSASLPIIVLRKYVSICELVRDRRLGMIIESLDELRKVKRVEKEMYKEWRKNAVIESNRIKTFDHYSTALEKL